MPEPLAASPALVELLAQLQLAAPGQVQSVAPLVARLGRDLPQFDCVWVDALAQARVLTPFQAARINAGRGAELHVGPYVLRAELPGPAYCRCYAATSLETCAPARLLVVPGSQPPVAEIAAQLDKLVELGRLATHPMLAVIGQAGVDGQRIWAACRPVEGQPASRWLTENGRLPAAAVLHMARMMLPALCELENLELVHGDLSVHSLLLLPEGGVTLAHPGLRPVVRPAEGYAFADLIPEAYDTLAPERIALAAAPSTATDIYALGCLWWHLTTGRPPFAGGNTLGKLQTVHAAKSSDVRQLAPDVPPRLAEAIGGCMQPDPQRRPASMQALRDMLGSPTRSAAHNVRRTLAEPQGPRRLWGAAPWPRESALARLTESAAVAACLALLLAGSVGWRYRQRLPWWPKAAASQLAAAPVRPLPEIKPSQNTSPTMNGDSLPSSDSPGAKQRTTGVVLASHAEPAPAPAKPARIEPYLLSCDQPQRPTEFVLRSGQVVRGADSRRPLVYVPPQGLTLRAEGTLSAGSHATFENIDFVWDTTAAPPAGSEGAGAAMIRLLIDRAEFRGCSFQDARNQLDRMAADWRPVAIRWLTPVAGREKVLPAGDLVCDHCVFFEVDAAVECPAGRAPSIDVRQSLHLRSGPLVRLGSWPRGQQAVTLTLSHTTVRASSAVLECLLQPEREGGSASLTPALSRREREKEAAPQANAGLVNVSAVDSVFALDSTAALLLFTGSEPAESLLAQLDWTGQGSLVTPTAVIAAWRQSTEAVPRTVAEERVQVAGLVRSQVEFAEDAAVGPAAARIRHWQAPLRSDEPPGASPGRLILPRVR